MTTVSRFVFSAAAAVILLAGTTSGSNAQSEFTHPIPVTLVLVDGHEFGDAAAVVLRRGEAGRHTVLFTRASVDARLVTEAFLIVQLDEATHPSQRENTAAIMVQGNMGLRPTGSARAALALLEQAEPKNVPQIGTYPSVTIGLRQSVRPPLDR